MGLCCCCIGRQEKQGSGICDIKTTCDGDGAVELVWFNIELDQYEIVTYGCWGKSLTHKDFKISKHVHFTNKNELKEMYQIVLSLPSQIKDKQKAVHTLETLLGI